MTRENLCYTHDMLDFEHSKGLFASIPLLTPAPKKGEGMYWFSFPQHIAFAVTNVRVGQILNMLELNYEVVELNSTHSGWCKLIDA